MAFNTARSLFEKIQNQYEKPIYMLLCTSRGIYNIVIFDKIFCKNG